MTLPEAFSKAVFKWVWAFILGLVLLTVPALFLDSIPDWIPIVILVLWGVSLLAVVIDTLRYRRQTK